jgi:hypothetical protein
MTMARHTDITNLLYRLARTGADARAIRRSVQTGSVAPIVKRVVRKRAHRAFGKALRGFAPMSRTTHLAPLDASRTNYIRTMIGGPDSGRTRREVWGAITADGLWMFDREDSPGTPWWIRHLPTDRTVMLCGSLRGCREAVGRGWADRALAQKQAEEIA